MTWKLKIGFYTSSKSHSQIDKGGKYVHSLESCFLFSVLKNNKNIVFKKIYILIIFICFFFFNVA